MGQEIVAVAPPSTPVVEGGAINDAQPMGAPPPTSLAPGFRFHPTDEELVRYYLRRKACGKPFRFQAVCEIDVYKSEPWELACYSSLKTRDLEWYFFSPIDRKYGNGSRLNRATGQGYWKATGKDRCVRHKSQTIGMKKTLVFHGGRAPDGKRTNWVMHEYRLVDEELERAGVAQDAFVLCRIFQKSGLGPPNGDRYAPFLDEEWDNDTILFIPGVEVEDDIANGDELRMGCNGFEQDMNKDPSQSEPLGISFICKREKSEDPEPLCLGQNKRAKQDDPNYSHANGSEDSTTTSQDPATTMTTTNVSSSLLKFPSQESVNVSSQLLEFPSLESIAHKESLPANTVTFDSSNLEKSVPPGYLKFISNLENEILNVSMERETLKIEVMRAQALINILQSRIDLLSKENEDLNKENENLRRLVRGG